jgi:hypothetical protein
MSLIDNTERRPRPTLLRALVLTLLAGPAALAAHPAAAATLAQIEDLEPGVVAVRGFYLDRPGEVRIQATGFAPSLRLGEASDAWILDADTREQVWSMRRASSHRRSRLREYDERVALAPGVYEVYYSTFPERGWGMVGVGDHEDSWWQHMLREIVGIEDYDERVAELGIKVSGTGRPVSERDLERARRTISDAALISLRDLGKGALAGRGFSLDRPAAVEVYAGGEVSEGGGYDYGWIADADTGSRVWTFDYAGSEPAGGAAKNRRVRRTVRLEPGRYAAAFITDDSHGPGDWNQAPPHDPAFWGLTLTLAPDDRRHATLFDWSPVPSGRPLLEIDRVGSSELREASFTLAKPTALRVFALGEGVGGSMVDYAWIADTRSGRKVWEMRYRQTVHGGGAQKNRLDDEVVELPAGQYRLCYTTDGSHAWDDWNSGPPFAPERWGVALYPPAGGRPGNSFHNAAFAVERERAPHAVLASLDRVGDREDLKERFRVDRPTRVEIRAVGEGVSDRMVDYGWLEEADSGRIVWEMIYRNTEPAGGAEKNRRFVGSLVLQPGEYALRYRTDSSHAWDDWNSDPPAGIHGSEPGWGILVARLGDG